MRYRSKPTEVEAEQYVGFDGVKGVCYCDTSVAHVHTMHGDQRVFLKYGDYVLPESDGVHYYPCDQDVFERTYERIED